MEQSHTSIAASREFGPILEDVFALTMLPLYRDTHAMGVVLSEEDNKKLAYLNEAMLASSASRKATYASWIGYFGLGKGKTMVMPSRLCWHSGDLGSST